MPDRSALEIGNQYCEGKTRNRTLFSQCTSGGRAILRLNLQSLNDGLHFLAGIDRHFLGFGIVNH